MCLTPGPLLSSLPTHPAAGVSALRSLHHLAGAPGSPPPYSRQLLPVHPTLGRVQGLANPQLAVENQLTWRTTESSNERVKHRAEKCGPTERVTCPLHLPSPHASNNFSLPSGRTCLEGSLASFLLDACCNLPSSPPVSTLSLSNLYSMSQPEGCF